eukprot:CAMPEP_0171535732 /NCGR_PEP_ID=MMETSP0959-20130129/17307_1 /TAXON_ID=87120 /ORGANISM="Aurantiochytrium limacinum, Strain ATCCMYA-1381" /LENGTH=57 /DNA_ID=CAMNT_0012081689 /DNA_START=37 /DNA_END=210 /DNA_ORIENTATION=+
MTLAKRIKDIREDTTKIDLGVNNIGDEGAKAVAKALEGCKNLRTLEYVCVHGKLYDR